MSEDVVLSALSHLRDLGVPEKALQPVVDWHANKQLQAAYEAGWSDACSDHLRQRRDPAWHIGKSKQRPYRKQAEDAA